MMFRRQTGSDRLGMFLLPVGPPLARLIARSRVEQPTLAAPSVSGHRSRDDRGVADVSRIRRFRGRVPLSPRGEHAS